ncbi:glycoside hydrolase family 97 protein [Pedobacter frigidisoli]|uniref:glycoside hydrolase family 97 protein n=1 Tax=Pedobacter frigidisoli TaxID=2530455 RepID=UPI00292D0094|nr:glycoside hydrolase family 97 catalytic domain-containing protein [Pedobacter frigidisoli]
MFNIKFCLAILLTLFSLENGFATEIVPGSEQILSSPDRKLTLSFFQQNDHNKRSFYYHLKYENKEVILPSKLNLELDNHLSELAMALKVDVHKEWFENLEIKAASRTQRDSVWRPIYGEQSSIRDQYNALTIETVKDDHPMYKMNIEFRLYNEGLAMRFYFPENEKGSYFKVISENTEFTMPDGSLAWVAKWAQAPYRKLPLVNWPEEAERPMTLQLKNGLFACLAEAGMVDYSRTKFKLSGTKANTIVTAMDSPVDLISPFVTPWRVVIIAETPQQLAVRNHLVLNLNRANKIENPNWIQPGKIMRVMSQTTKDALDNIDFARQRNLQYILFDWKWYGPAFSFDSDATKVAIKDFDLPAIIKYGKEKGVGVWLYVNQQALLAQSDSLFSVYRKWGIAGVKFGFVQVGSHRWTTWIQKAIQQAAANHIMVNIHDDWRPTGEQRTWPNLMTAEGVRGNEEMPDATHNTILPFTRYIAGAADYTICYFDKRIKTTHAHQLALGVIYFSPIQTLYWYDKPSAYQNEPELEFWDRLPVSWDETIVLQGMPGEFITTARRKDKDWFIGSITNNFGRVVKLDFSFLPKGKRYTAKIFSDDDSIHTQTKVAVNSMTVNASTVLSVHLKPSGGLAIWLSEK